MFIPWNHRNQTNVKKNALRKNNKIKISKFNFVISYLKRIMNICGQITLIMPNIHMELSHLCLHMPTIGPNDLYFTILPYFTYLFGGCLMINLSSL